MDWLMCSGYVESTCSAVVGLRLVGEAVAVVQGGLVRFPSELDQSGPSCLEVGRHQVRVTHRRRLLLRRPAH